MSLEGKNATQTRKKICAVYWEDAVSDRMCQKWFAKFRSGEMNIEDAPRSGRPVTTDVDQITALIDSDRQISSGNRGKVKHWQISCFRTFK
ncbi:PREDICTED: histone-lysine N-methyltransferase SETMAR-like [Trachymyrmex cornetzi]|uniref:histone-lysine N-methyltransferase SETMAR-like n=1 Tax=Trachymyrmex cornetzi TaxID=471704 RepID=UPI00084F487D|nr:PREDICTED: histone-lysine N-methyltransferase SETMAR-like [Trachymyrmex cornetzi]